MSDTLVLRPATLSDASALASTIAAAFEQYRGKLIPESGAFGETTESIVNDLQNGMGGIVAERNGKTIGSVMTLPLHGDLYFGRLAVLPEVRGMGRARRLIAVVEVDARARRMAGVRLSVRVVLAENQRMFMALGYREISRDSHPGFDYPTSINMRKALS